MSNLSILQNKDLKISTVHLLQSINEIRQKNGEKEIRSNDFIARVADELEGEHYESFVVENSNKTKTHYFMISIEQAKLVAMRESKSVRKIVRDKLNELENKNKFKIPQTLPEALRLAADLADQLAAQAPMVEVYKLLADRKGDVSTTIIAKELGTTAIKLNKFLRDKGFKWLNADLPKAGYEKYFNVVADVKNGHEFTQCLVTPEGQIYIAKLWSER